jgi:hypothetical protein
MATFQSAPDPRYYQNILQHDDGTYTADPKPLDDLTTTRMNPADQANPMIVIIYGLRSVVRDTMINPSISAYIYKYAPDYAQRNANNIISQPANYTPQQVQDAKDMWTWINAVVAYGNSLTTQIQSMTFNQIVVWVVPSTGWPVPPDSLIPTPPPPLH